MRALQQGTPAGQVGEETDAWCGAAQARSTRGAALSRLPMGAQQPPPRPAPHFCWGVSWSMGGRPRLEATLDPSSSQRAACSRTWAPLRPQLASSGDAQMKSAGGGWRVRCACLSAASRAAAASACCQNCCIPCWGGTPMNAAPHLRGCHPWRQARPRLRRPSWQRRHRRRRRALAWCRACHAAAARGTGLRWRSASQAVGSRAQGSGEA